MAHSSSGAKTPQQNIALNDGPGTENQPVEQGDPYLLFNQTFDPNGGLYFYDPIEGQYTLLVGTADALSAFAYAAYGSMGLSSPVIGLDITPVFQPITFYDTVNISPRGIVLNTVTGEFQFLLEGVYAISVVFALGHNEVNNTRTMTFRLFNVTDSFAVTTTESIISTPRDTEATFFSVTFVTEVTTSEAGDSFVVQVGDSSGSPQNLYSSVVWNTCGLSLWNVGEFRGVLGQLVVLTAGTIDDETEVGLDTEAGDPITTEHP